MTDLALRPSLIEISPRARQRMASMRVTPEAVEAAIEEPEVSAQNRAGDWMVKRDGVVVVYTDDAGRKVAKTVLRWYEWANLTDLDPMESEAVAEMAEAGPAIAQEDSAFRKQLERWGFHRGRRGPDFVQWRGPHGGIIRVPPLDHPDGNSQEALFAACELLGVTAERFWAREEQYRPPRERVFASKTGVMSPERQAEWEAAAAKRLMAFRDADDKAKSSRRREPSRDSRAGRVLDWFELRPTTVHDAATIAEDVEIDIQLVRMACASLCRDGHLQRVTRGQYRLVGADEDETDRRLAEINAQLATTDDVLLRADLIQERIALLNGTSSAPAGTVEASTATVGATKPSFGSLQDDYDEEIDTLLGLLAPDGIRPHHELAVARWRSATRTLIDQLQT